MTNATILSASEPYGSNRCDALFTSPLLCSGLRVALAIGAIGLGFEGHPTGPVAKATRSFLVFVFLMGRLEGQRRLGIFGE
jgi:hypothetical protein